VVASTNEVPSYYETAAVLTHL